MAGLTGHLLFRYHKDGEALRRNRRVEGLALAGEGGLDRRDAVGSVQGVILIEEAGGEVDALHRLHGFLLLQAIERKLHFLRLFGGIDHLHIDLVPVSSGH